jgi:hypothetical protein
MRFMQVGSFVTGRTSVLVPTIRFDGTTSTATTTQSATGTATTTQSATGTGTTTQSATATTTQSATATTTQSATATTTQSATATTTSCIVPAGVCEALGDGTWQAYDDLASRAEGRSSCWRSSLVDRVSPTRCALLVPGAHLLTSRASAGQGLLGAIAAAGRGDGWVGAASTRTGVYSWVDGTPANNLRQPGGGAGSAWAAKFPKYGPAEYTCLRPAFSIDCGAWGSEAVCACVCVRPCGCGMVCVCARMRVCLCVRV